MATHHVLPQIPAPAPPTLLDGARKEVSLVQSLVTHMDFLQQELGTVIRHLESLYERVYGPQPVEGAPDKDPVLPPDNCLLHGIEIVTHLSTRNIERLRVVADKLDRIA